jgi:hypothetical protein
MAAGAAEKGFAYQSAATAVGFNVERVAIVISSTLCISSASTMLGPAESG